MVVVTVVVAAAAVVLVLGVITIFVSSTISMALTSLTEVAANKA